MSTKTIKMLAVMAVCFATPALAGKTKAPADAGDLVVATVNGEKITLSEIDNILNTNAQLASLPKENMYEPLLDNLIDMTIIANAAKAEKLQNDLQYKKMVKDAEKQLLVRYYMEKHAKDLQTKDKLQAMYEQFKKENPPQEEMSAAHILLKTEKEANDVIKQLKKGADFAELANKLSENKGLEGGDLGYFSRELMVPEFSEAAFKMKEGEISEKPVKTKFGYHVIKAGARRMAEPPKFEEVEKELTQLQMNQAVEQILSDLRSKAKIVKTPVKFEPDGRVVKAPKK